MESVLADVRQSLRLLRKSPGFTAVAIAALALGIGANTGIFSVINKVILEPLPYPQPERIVKLGRKYPDGTGYSNSVPKYMAWRHNDVFSEMAIYDQGGPGLNLTAGDRPEQVKGIHVSADYFKVFGASPMRGRYFSAQEDSPNGPKAAIISEKLWRSRFGGDPQMVGRTIQLNGEAYPVVGIMPGSFVPDPPADVWIPIQADPNSTNQGHYLSVAARLKPGVTIEQARGEMKRVGEGFRRENPKWMDKNESVAVVPMREAMVGNVKIALYVLLGAVLLVLLIACANVANLLLARAATRQRELAIRAAIGATRGRVIRQLLTESVILACIGGICGLLLGGWGVRTLLLFVPGDIPRLTSQEHVQGLFSILDWRIVLFAVGVSFLTGIIFGLFPALHISNPDVASTLREASGRTGTGRKQNRVRKVLVGIEMALALVLLTSAVLLIRTFVGLSSVQSGIDPHNVLTLQTSLAGGNYSTTDKVDRFATQVVRRLETLPGVQSAALAVALPTQTEIDLPFAIAGKAPKSGQTYNGDEQYRFISPHYFAVFKIPLLRGRYFDERDVQNGAKVVIINQAMAKKYWPKDDALGAVITIGKGLGPQFEDAPRQVVGIVGDVRESGLADKDVGVMYLPQSQVPDGVTQLANSALPLGWCIRTATDPNTLRTAVQREFQAVDSLMPVSKMRPMEEVLAEGVARQRFNMLLLSIFAGIALILAAIGIYGLMSYSVEQQTQELGIRMALGAGRAEVLRLIVRQGMIPAIAGVAVGLAIAFALTQLLSTLLYGVKANDPLTYASVALVLLLVALFSTWVPALRAARIDPATALRDEV
ncbi:MAG TPA: ABC transporter permease [Bryobacteraceae bacterium]|jgi:predicted permease|nr:ABC transporter permease [Bryobacteraceae bacterium]